MKTFARVRVACLAGAALLVGALSTSTSSALDDNSINITTAVATIAGAPGSGISGFVRFIQTAGGNLPTVTVIAFVRGLPPNTTHGIHIHENAACDPPGFMTAGGHFDPGPFGMSNPDANHPFHMGDLPNLKANGQGIAFFEHRSSRITLTDSPITIFDANGSAVIVHANPDQGITGPPGSGVSGGPRIACGIIRRGF